LGDQVERLVVYGRPVLSRPITKLIQDPRLDTVIVHRGGGAWFDLGRVAGRVASRVIPPAAPADAAARDGQPVQSQGSAGRSGSARNEPGTFPADTTGAQPIQAAESAGLERSARNEPGTFPAESSGRERPDPWLDAWQQAGLAIWRQLEAEPFPNGPAVAAATAAAVRASGGPLVVGASSAIRDLDLSPAPGCPIHDPHHPRFGRPGDTGHASHSDRPASAHRANRGDQAARTADPDRPATADRVNPANQATRAVDPDPVACAADPRRPGRPGDLAHPEHGLSSDANPCSFGPVLAMRGLAGIDGTVSFAGGVALALSEPVTVLLGDLALAHDAGGLAIPDRERRPNLRVVVLEDAGGAIFETLEPAGPDLEPAFERFFATPLRLDLASLAAAYGASFTRARTADELATALREPIRDISLVAVPLERSGRRGLEAQIVELSRNALESPSNFTALREDSSRKARFDRR
jgi:2-succinyl-5-enolpyruvyl-6-hydroxy-3-cyclohexene-1-carboxylate synthase